VSPDPSAILAALARMRANFNEQMDAFEAAVRGAGAARPAAPTRAWCLPSPGVVRWEGETTVPLRRWHALDAILSRDGPLPVEALEAVAGELSDPALRTFLYRLSRDLEAVNWPVTDYRLRGGLVVAD
jgi:hypothetical protein